MKSMSILTFINEVIDSILNQIAENEKQDDSLKVEKVQDVSKDVAVANNQIRIFDSNRKSKGSNHQPQTTVEDSPAPFDSTLTDACSTSNELKSLSNKLCMFNSNPDTLRPTSAPPLKMLNSFSLLSCIRPVKSDFLLAEEIRWSYKTERETSLWIKNPVLNFDSYIYDEENFVKLLSFNKTDKHVIKKQLECFQASPSLSQESNGNFSRKSDSLFQDIMIPNFLNLKNAYSVKEKNLNPCEILETNNKEKKVKSYENFSIVNKSEKDSSIILNRIANQIKYFCGDMNDKINKKLELVEPSCKRTADKGKFTKEFLEKQHSDYQKGLGEFNVERLNDQDKSMSDEVHLAGEKSKTFTPATTDIVESFTPAQIQFSVTNLIELYAAEKVNSDFSNQKVILVKSADCIENKKAQTQFCETNLIEKAPINEFCSAEEVNSGINKQKITLIKSFDVAGSENNLHTSYMDDNEFSKPADADRMSDSGDNPVGGKKVITDEINPQHETDYQVDSAVKEELSSYCPDITSKLELENLQLENVIPDTDCVPVCESDSLGSVEIPVYSGSSEYHSTESWMVDQSWTDTLNSSSFYSEKTYVLQNLKSEEKLCRPVVKSKSVLESDLTPNAKRKSRFVQFLSGANKSIRGHFKTLRRSCNRKKSCKPRVFSSIPLFLWCM